MVTALIAMISHCPLNLMIGPTYSWRILLRLLIVSASYFSSLRCSYSMQMVSTHFYLQGRLNSSTVSTTSQPLVHNAPTTQYNSGTWYLLAISILVQLAQGSVQQGVHIVVDCAGTLHHTNTHTTAGIAAQYGSSTTHRIVILASTHPIPSTM